MRRMRRLAGDVFDFAQAKEWLSGYRRGTVERGAMRRATARMQLPRLRWAQGPHEIWAVATVRDELDVVEASIRHLLDQRVSRVLVSDHLSTDGTRELLTELSQGDPRIQLALDEEPGHFQKEKITRLSRAARWAGAEWVIPFDADEFWFAEQGSLADYLRSRRESVVIAEMHDVVPVDDGAAPFREREFMVDAAPSGDVKVAFRAHPLVRVGPGNHGVDRVGEQTGGLKIAHVPYRGTAQLARKFQTGASALDLSGASAWEGWHWRAGAELNAEQLDQLWAAIRQGDTAEPIGWLPSGSWTQGRLLQRSQWSSQPDGASD